MNISIFFRIKSSPPDLGFLKTAYDKHIAQDIYIRLLIIWQLGKKGGAHTHLHI